jgi:oligopeptidase B
VPERRTKILEAHGDERVDDWYWLGNRTDSAVLDHLRAENAYTEAAVAPFGALRETLFDEIVARIEETDLSVPVKKGGWWYYQRTEEKKSYAVHCRRPAAPGEAPPVASGPVSDEEVLLDENALAEGTEYFAVGNLAVSPNHGLLAYATDKTGAELYDLRFATLHSGDGATRAEETVSDTYYGLAWANDNATVFYTRVDEAMRPYQLWRHGLGTDPTNDAKIIEEPDEQFTLSLGRSKDGAFVVVSLQSTTTSEVWVIPADDPEMAPRVIEPRRPGIEYGVEHLGHSAGPGSFVILTNDGAEDFRLMVAPENSPGRDSWRPIIGHRPGTRLDDVDVFDRWLVIAERFEGEPRLRVVPLEPGGPDPFAGDLLTDSWLVGATEHPSSTWEGPNPEPSATTLRYEQTSLVSPRAVFDADMTTGKSVLLKRQPVLGDYDPASYRTFRVWVDAGGGTTVPMSIVHRADLLADPSAPDGTPPVAPAPCLLYGYGAYEISIDPAFSSLRLSLLDRGFVFAIAHVRGGGELGRGWYEDGKLANKPHTFTDFIACARHLIDSGFTSADRLTARGGSAGGLLIGAVINQAPELFAAVVAEVPFVDCLTTMLDDSLPLTVGEWEEWGNPAADPAAYATIKSYSPYDNIVANTADGSSVDYPDVLATAGLHDPRVGYWEPAKWVARLRDADPSARVLLKTELVAGHGGPSGRYDAWKDEAQVYAFLLDALGLG